MLKCSDFATQAVIECHQFTLQLIVATQLACASLIALWIAPPLPVLLFALVTPPLFVFRREIGRCLVIRAYRSQPPDDRRWP